MKSPVSKRAPQRTADMFAEAAVAAPAKKPQAAALPATAPAKRSNHLWYAAVFTELPEDAVPEAALQRLSLHALAFTSFVSIEAPHALLLEIRGSVKLFGSLPHLHEDIDASWARLALKYASAIAPSTLAALWMARARAVRAAHFTHGIAIDETSRLPGQLAKVPIACTGWDAERLKTLRAMGITCVGELFRLPRGGLARRLGPGVVQDLDIVLAKQPAPRRAFVPRERFKERCDFEFEVEHAGYLATALEPIIERCARFLQQRQAGVQRLQLALRHREMPATKIQAGLASITGERRRLSDVLLQKLARIELEAAVRSMSLISGPLCALPASSLDAFAGSSAAGGRDSAPQLLERLRARLGDSAVYGIISIAEHRPEAAWRRVTELRCAPLPARSDPSILRPVWLLEEPLEIRKPQILHGPERIESGWWDGKGVARDYYVARHTRGVHTRGVHTRGVHTRGVHTRGARLWVFQERRSMRWFLHGLFA